MYQILCDDHVIYDPRDESLTVLEPRLKMAINTAGESSFVILPNHPFYDQLHKLKSVFTVMQDGSVLFRGRMTDDSRDFYNRLTVDIEGALAYTNDTIIPPFDYPGNDETTSGNAVEAFLRWILTQHNAQAQPFQQIKLGTVTVTDPNNYITRSSSSYASTWDTLKNKLFESTLGGYMLMRYESDGNYLDYLAEFPLTNAQDIVFGENLLELENNIDATPSYSAMLPQGAETLATDGTKTVVTLATLPDGSLTDDIVKQGVYIYSRSAVERYGWVCCPLKESKWADVNTDTILQTKAVQQLSGGIAMQQTVTVQAVDLHYSDDEIQSFRIGRNIRAVSAPHGLNTTFMLTELDIDLQNPQETVITAGATKATMTGDNGSKYDSSTERIEQVADLLTGVWGNVASVEQQVDTLETSMVSTAESIILNALHDYTRTGDFETFRETVQSQLAIMADSINLNFTQTTESIDNVNGDLQRRFSELSKYIRFSADGIEIGMDENALKLTLDNDLIRFTKNGLPVGWWDGTDFHTGNIVVEVNERAQFGNFAFVPRSDGSLMFLKVNNNPVSDAYL